jgi:hypothetical protein
MQAVVFDLISRNNVGLGAGILSCKSVCRLNGFYLPYVGGPPGDNTRADPCRRNTPGIRSYSGGKEDPDKIKNVQLKSPVARQFVVPFNRDGEKEIFLYLPTHPKTNSTPH